MAWMPASRMGRYAVWSAVAFILLLVVNVITQFVTEPTRDEPRSWYGLTLVWLGISAAVAAAVLALVAIIRDKDRAFLTWLALAPAAFVLVFEVVFE